MTKMTFLRFPCLLLLLLLATLLLSSEGIVLRNSCTPKTGLRASSEGDNDTSSFPQQPQQADDQQLDPLIMSLTRNDQVNTENTNTIKAPLLGELAIDGSLVVLVPALVIGVVGFAMSINIAMNSGDAIVDSLNQLSEDVTAAAVAKTNMAAPLGDGCRGICSGNNEGLERFMESLRK